MALRPLDASSDASLDDFGTDAGLLDGGLEDASIALDGAMPILRSCQELYMAGYRTSQCYWIDPDGPGGDPPIDPYCDMDTMDGGWTVIFFPNESVADPMYRTLNFFSRNIDYTFTSIPLLASATEVMLAHRNLDTKGVVRGIALPVRFPMPRNWKTHSPFRFAGENEVVSLTTEAGITFNSGLTYGWQNWSEIPVDITECQRVWMPATIGPDGVIVEGSSQLGKVCLTPVIPRATDPLIPAFWGFAGLGADYCNIGSGPAASSTVEVPDICWRGNAFTIAIR